jgi:hypothetical protein
LLLVSALLVEASALANGRFPQSNLVVFAPRDADHLAVRTTFGLLESKDGGETFRFTCESALALGVEEDPMFVLTSEAHLLVATFGGLLRSEDGCTFPLLPDVAGEIVPDLASSPSAPDTAVAFTQFGLGAGRYRSRVLRSDDGGRSFREQTALPPELLPLSVDLAARDAERVYLTARGGSESSYASLLLVSSDGGQSFASIPIPDTSEHRLAYIAAVDPGDRDRLYLRIDDPAGTVVLEVTQAGAAFVRRFAATGRLPAFAVSPDGSEIALGGPDDGLWVGAADSGAFERRADLRPTCLGWRERGLFACADLALAGFSFGRSDDGGRSFEPLLAFDAFCGSSDCGADTDVGQLCQRDWESVAPSLGTSCSAAGGKGEGGTVGVDATGGVAPDPSPREARPARGCSSSGSRPRSGPAGLIWFVFVTLGLGVAKSQSAARREFRRAVEHSAAVPNFDVECTRPPRAP